MTAKFPRIDSAGVRGAGVQGRKELGFGAPDRGMNMDTPKKIDPASIEFGLALGIADLWRGGGPPDLDEAIAQHQRAAKEIQAYGEQCRRAGAEARRAIVCEEWQAFASTKGVTAAALIASILNRFDALPSAAEAASPAAGWRPIAEAQLPNFGDVPSYWVFKAIVAPYYDTSCEASYSFTNGGKGRWFTARGRLMDPQPTHFMPLPDPPAPSEEARDGDG